MSLSTLQTIQIMEFPITRLGLKNFRKNQAARLYAKYRVEAIVKHICSEIETIALTTRSFQYVYRFGQKKYAHPYSDLYTELENTWILAPVPLLPIVDDILKKLDEYFPDSRIVVDPLKTYILIDWA